MTQEEIPVSLLNALTRLDWHIDVHSEAWLKCNEPVMLWGDDYHAGMNLKEVGFMEVTFKPIWKKGIFSGFEVWFKNYSPDKI